jgi:hypothetical protein
MQTPIPAEDAITRMERNKLEQDRRTDRNRVVLGVTTVAAAAIMWWVMWVGPYNTRLNEIMDCMGDDASREAYTRCAQKLR